MLVWFLAGMWGLVLCFEIVQKGLDTFWAILSIFFPPTYVLAPVYAGIKHGNWFPLLVIYGGGLGGLLLTGLGGIIEGALLNATPQLEAQRAEEYQKKEAVSSAPPKSNNKKPTSQQGSPVRQTEPEGKSETWALIVFIPIFFIGAYLIRSSTNSGSPLKQANQNQQKSYSPEQQSKSPKESIQPEPNKPNMEPAADLFTKEERYILIRDYDFDPIGLEEGEVTREQVFAFIRERNAKSTSGRASLQNRPDLSEEVLANILQREAKKTTNPTPPSSRQENSSQHVAPITPFPVPSDPEEPPQDSTKAHRVASEENHPAQNSFSQGKGYQIIVPTGWAPLLDSVIDQAKPSIEKVKFTGGIQASSDLEILMLPNILFGDIALDKSQINLFDTYPPMKFSIKSNSIETLVDKIRNLNYATKYYKRDEEIYIWKKKDTKNPVEDILGGVVFSRSQGEGVYFECHYGFNQFKPHVSICLQVIKSIRASLE